MNFDKVVSGFFIILAMTLNFGFFYGDLTDIELHSKYELFAALVVLILLQQRSKSVIKHNWVPFY